MLQRNLPLKYTTQLYKNKLSVLKRGIMDEHKFYPMYINALKKYLLEYNKRKA